MRNLQDQRRLQYALQLYSRSKQRTAKVMVCPGFEPAHELLYVANFLGPSRLVVNGRLRVQVCSVMFVRTICMLAA